jgi:hypothetical protein
VNKKAGRKKLMLRLTWRHEIYIPCDTVKEGREIWENVNLDNLAKAKQEGKAPEFVELVSAEIENEDYRDVLNEMK